MLNRIEVAHDRRVVLASPAFVFTLDTSDGLRAVSWENRLSGRTLELGCGPEVEFDLGLPEQPLLTPRLRVTILPTAATVASRMGRDLGLAWLDSPLQPPRRLTPSS